MYEGEVDKLLEAKEGLTLIDLRKKSLYGKIDLKNKVVVPRLENLSSFQGVANVFPFVRDALDDLSSKLKKRSDRGTIKKRGPYSTLSATPRPKTWQDEYANYLKDIKESYQDRIRSTPGLKDSVADFKQYVFNFLEFSTIANPRYPLTFSKFYLSSHSSTFATGITVDLNSEEYGDDYVSFSKYFGDVNFDIFYQEAQNHGFLLDRYAPWRLVANLTSQPMISYMKKSGYANMQDVFSELTFNPLSPEFYELVKMINFSYSEVFKPNSTVADVCYREGKTSYSLKPREMFDPSQFKSLEEMVDYMGYAFWLRAYAFIKAREINKNLTQKEFDDIVKESIAIQKHVDTEASLSYINDKFNPLMNSDFNRKPTFTF